MYTLNPLHPETASVPRLFSICLETCLHAKTRTPQEPEPQRTAGTQEFSGSWAQTFQGLGFRVEEAEGPKAGEFTNATWRVFRGLSN